MFLKKNRLKYFLYFIFVGVGAPNIGPIIPGLISNTVGEWHGKAKTEKKDIPN